MDIEQLIYLFVDEIKYLSFPDEWSDIFLDYSKNEIFVLLYLFKYKEANMSQVSEYIKSPLNTTTGIVDRLVKKGLIQRIRSSIDRRVVLLTLTNKSNALIKDELKTFEKYFLEIYSSLTDNERETIKKVYVKIRKVLFENETKKKSKQEIKKIIIE